MLPVSPTPAMIVTAALAMTALVLGLRALGSDAVLRARLGSPACAGPCAARLFLLGAASRSSCDRPKLAYFDTPPHIWSFH